MRTTEQLDDDTTRAVEEICAAEGLSVSEAVTMLIRRALLRLAAPPPFHQRTAPLGVRIAVSHLADALDVLEGPHAH